MLSPDFSSPTNETFSPRIIALVPVGDNTLGVLEAKIQPGAGTTEDQLRHLGKSCINTPLSVRNGGYEDRDHLVYATKPVETYEAGTLSFLDQNMGDLGWVRRKVADQDEESYIIHDLNQPAIRVVALDKTE